MGWIHFQNNNPVYRVKTNFPTAIVSGDQSVCAGTDVTIEVGLTGYPPWQVHWSDGTVQTDITSSPFHYTVSPQQTTIYSVTHVADAFAQGNTEGQAVIDIASFMATTVMSGAARGWDPEVLTALESCGTPPINIHWSIISGPDSGYSFGFNENPVTLDFPHPIPDETTGYQASITDSQMRTTLLETRYLLVASDPMYFDTVPDQCNNLLDLWALCPQWREPHPDLDDPNGDGNFTVVDFLYINLSDPLDCMTSKN